MRTRTAGAAALIVCLIVAGAVLSAHGVSTKDGRYLRSLDGAAVLPLMYLGAKHMVTGYDHLLFLVGVIFFLYKLRHVALYVTLFSIGHSATLLFGVPSYDPAALALALAALCAIAFVATYAPARRATRIEPVSALRAE